jgi:hypothetical protein
MENTENTETFLTKEQLYNKNYYHNKYKDIIKSKKTYCDKCCVEVSSWNYYKHKNSKKHKLNCLEECEKNDLVNYILKEKAELKLQKAEQKLQKLEEEKNSLLKQLVELNKNG